MFIVEYLMYIYVYTYFIHDTHIVFHISYLMYFCSQIRRRFFWNHISNFQLLEDLDIIEAAHGRHNNTNEPGTEFVAWILDGTSMLIADVDGCSKIEPLCIVKPLRKTQFVMCETNNEGIAIKNGNLELDLGVLIWSVWNPLKPTY